MNERRSEHRSRTLRSGKIVFNNKHSVIDCIVRNLSDGGACLQVNQTSGIPSRFELTIDGEAESHLCQMIWMSESRVGIEFRKSTAAHAGSGRANDPAPVAVIPTPKPSQAEPGGVELLRGELLAVRVALDEVPVGVVVLDADTRAQFINRAFRRMWRLPDAKADSKPPFVALMYHGRDTHAYAVAPEHLDAYVAERVAHVKSGNRIPLDLRLANGEVIRLQCSPLPSGGRMLCYTYVTDIVRHSDELKMLRGALDQMQQGIVLLDDRLNAQFMNRAVRELWNIPDEQADRRPNIAELVSDSRRTGTYGVPAEELDEYITGRIAIMRAGDPTPVDIPHNDGRIIRSQCTILPNGGRMVTYTEVTDLVRRADQFARAAAE